MPRLTVHCHARPVVCPATVLPGVLRPRLVTKISRMRDGMERTSEAGRCERRRRECRLEVLAAFQAGVLQQ